MFSQLGDHRHWLLLTQRVLECSLAFVTDIVGFLIDTDNSDVDALLAQPFHSEAEVIEITDDSIDLLLLRLCDNLHLGTDSRLSHGTLSNQIALLWWVQRCARRRLTKDAVVPSHRSWGQDLSAAIDNTGTAPNMFTIDERHLMRKKVFEQLPSDLVPEGRVAMLVNRPSEGRPEGST